MEVPASQQRRTVQARSRLLARAATALRRRSSSAATFGRDVLHQRVERGVERRLWQQRRRQSEDARGHADGHGRELLAAVVAEHLQGSDHHRRGHRRRTRRIERRIGTGGRYARLGRQDRQAGVDIPHRAAARGIRLRHVGREQREEPVRRQCLGLYVARRRAWHPLHAARRPEQRPRRHRPPRQQFVLVLGGRGRREHRQVSLALPARASRHLGLRHPVGAACRRPGPERDHRSCAHRGEQGRPAVHAQSRHRQADLRYRRAPSAEERRAGRSRRLPRSRSR